jgi:hypothetical protein
VTRDCGKKVLVLVFVALESRVVFVRGVERAGRDGVRTIDSRSRVSLRYGLYESLYSQRHPKNLVKKNQL